MLGQYKKHWDVYILFEFSSEKNRDDVCIVGWVDFALFSNVTQLSIWLPLKSFDHSSYDKVQEFCVWSTQ